MNFALRLKRVRLEKGLSQSALADLSGIAQPNLAAMESARRQPTLASLARLAEALACPQSELLGEGARPFLGRFERDDLCRRLVTGQSAPSALDPRIWSDLEAVFHDKLKALYPGSLRSRPRISARAAQSRLNARLGLDGFRMIAGRLDKAYPR